MLALQLYLVKFNFIYLFIYHLSYECYETSTNCTSCDDSNTHRSFSAFACPCTMAMYFDDGSNKVC